MQAVVAVATIQAAVQEQMEQVVQAVVAMADRQQVAQQTQVEVAVAALTDHRERVALELLF